MTGDFELVAERALICREDDYDRPIKIQIGKPYWIEPAKEAACPVRIEGLLERRRDIRGEDLMHALQLACVFANTFLTSGSKERKILWPDGEDYIE